MPAESSFVFPLVLAGALLTSVGVASLARVVLRRMPRGIGVGLIVGGLAVAAYGLTFRAEPTPTPRASLEPTASGLELPIDIAGTVTDGAGAPVAGLPVRLHRYERTSEVETRTQSTDPSGAFSFGTLTAGATAGFRVTTTFADTEYSSDLLLPGPHAIPVDFVVAAATSDASVIRVASDSTTVVGDASGAQVVHVLTVENSSPQAFVGGLKLPYLDGAQGFEPRRGVDRTRLAFEADGVRATQPIPPGASEIVYLYTVAIPRSGLVAARTVDYPTDRLDLLVGGELEPSELRGLKPGDEVTISGKHYTRTSAAAKQAGDRIAARVRVRSEDSALRTGLIVGGGAVAVVVLGFGLARRRRAEP